MDSKSEIQDHLIGGEVMNLRLKFIEGSDEEIING